jgi:alanine-synthesizing transaminase
MESVITEILQSEKLKDVNYEIRGPVLDYANFLEQEGQQILKLNIGNPGAFGFDAPDEIIRDVIHNLRKAQGYSQSKGIFTARKAVVQSYQSQGVSGLMSAILLWGMV